MQEGNLAERLSSFVQSESNNLDYNLLLYDFPELYYAYLEHQDRYPFIDSVIAERCPDLEHGILDLGCGGGKILAGIGNQNGKNVRKVGIDAHKAMIAYGREQFGDDLELHVGDVKSFRYPHKFSLVLCIGTVLQYAYTNEEVISMLETIKQHLAPGGCVILDVKNSISYLGGYSGLTELTKDRTVDFGFFKGSIHPRHSFDLKSQLLKLHVDWKVTEPIEAEFTDFCQFRLIFPQELTFMAESVGLRILSLTDSFSHSSLEDSIFDGDRLVVVAGLDE